MSAPPMLLTQIAVLPASPDRRVMEALSGEE
jgi:hypothetical protein